MSVQVGVKPPDVESPEKDGVESSTKNQPEQRDSTSTLTSSYDHHRKHTLAKKGSLGNMRRSSSVFTLASDLTKRQNSLFIIPSDSAFAAIMAQILISNWFQTFCITTILANTAWICISSPFDPDLTFYLGELVFISCFAFETVVRIVGSGLVLHQDAYLRDKWNIFDLAVIVSNALSMFFPALKALRILPPLRFFARLTSMRVITTSLLVAIPKLLQTIIVFVAIIIFFSVLGVNLFSGILHQRCYDSFSGDMVSESLCSNVDSGGSHCPSHQFCADNGQDNPSGPWTGFDSVPLGAMSVLQFITLDNWSQNMYDITAAFTEPISVVFFLCLIIVGTFTVINLLLAVITESYTELSTEQRAKLEAETIRRKESFASRASHSRMASLMKLQLYQKLAAASAQEELKKAQEKEERRKKRRKKRRRQQKRKLEAAQAAANGLPPPHKAKKKNAKKPPPPKLTPKEKLKKARRRTASFLNSKYFEIFFLIFIVGHCAFLSYLPSPESRFVSMSLYLANLAFSVIYLVETTLQLFANGFRKFSKKKTNWIDLLITLSGLVQIVVPEYSAISALQVARLYKLFTSRFMWSSLQDLVSQIVQSVSNIAGLVAMILMTLLLFAFAGRALLGGQYNNLSLEEKPRTHFDNIFDSFLTCFAIMTGAGWTDAMHSSMDASGPWAAGFFLALYLVSNFLLLNCFVAILLDSVSIDPPEEKEKAPSLWGSKLFAFFCCGEAETGEFPSYSFDKNGMLPMIKIERTQTENFENENENENNSKIVMSTKVPPLPLPPSALHTHTTSKIAPAIDDRNSAWDPRNFISTPENSIIPTPKLKIEINDGIIPHSPGKSGGGGVLAGTPLANLPGYIASLTPKKDKVKNPGETEHLLKQMDDGDSPRDENIENENENENSENFENSEKSKKEVSFQSDMLTTLKIGAAKDRLLIRNRLAGRSGGVLGGTGGAPPPGPLLPSQRLFATLIDLPPVKEQKGAVEKRLKSILKKHMKMNDEAAATRIQAAERGRQTRKRVEALKEHKKSELLKKEKAAVTIQKRVRGMQTREKYLQEKQRQQEQKEREESEKRKLLLLQKNENGISGVFGDSAELRIDMENGEPNQNQNPDLATSPMHSDKMRFSMRTTSFALPTIIEEETEQEENMPGVFVAETHYPLFCGGYKWGRDKSCGMWKPQHPFRKKCLKILNQPLFNLLLSITIIVSAAPLALSSPSNPFSEGWITIIRIFNAFATALYMFEAVIKVIAFGLIAHPKAFLQDPWNIFDFVFVIVCIVDVASSFGGHNVAMINMLRAIQPFRLVKRFKGLKDTVTSLMISIPGVLDVIVISMVLFFACGTVGIRMFSGKFGQCTDPSVFLMDDCIGMFVDSDGNAGKRLWTASYPNFDNIESALIAVLQIATGDNWTDLMYRGIDSTSTSTGPLRDYNPSVALYFIIVVFLCSFFVLQLVIAVLVSRFFKAKWRESRVEAVMETRIWIQIHRALFYSLNPFTNWVHAPLNKFRKFIFKIVTSKIFEFFIGSCVIINVAVMCTLHYKQTEFFVFWQFWISRVLTMVFVAETGLMMLGKGPKTFFKDGWNRFDFVVVVLSALAEFVSEYLPSGSGGMTKLFRIARIFRLFTVSPGLRRVVATLLITLPYLGHVAMLFFLVLFAYACIGVQLFSEVKFGENLNENANFTSFPMAVLTLFRVVTGDGWMGLMSDLAVQPPNCDMDLNECGQPVASPIYFSTFTIVSSLILLNLLVGIILENFSANMPNTTVKEDHVFKYSALWLEYDPKNLRHIHMLKLPEFLLRLETPLGLNVKKGNSTSKKLKSKNSKNCLTGSSGDDDFDKLSLRDALAVMDKIPTHYGQVDIHYKDVLTCLAFRAYDLDFFALPRQILITLDQGWRPQYSQDPPLPNGERASVVWAAIVIQDRWRLRKLSRSKALLRAGVSRKIEFLDQATSGFRELAREERIHTNVEERAKKVHQIGKENEH